MELPFSVSATETAALRTQSVDFVLLDVREPDEVATCRIQGSLHIPMRDIPSRMAAELPDKDRRIIAHCHHGMRSARVTEFLRQQGYTQVQNMEGGIEAWSESVDPSVPRY